MARPPQIEVRVLRVFCGEDDTCGNPLGVVLDGRAVAVDDRQAFAAHLGYSETVFVEDTASGRIAIFTPEVELPFAGHPTVGAAWLLAREGHAVDSLRTPAGKVTVRVDGEITFVTACADWCPPFELEQLSSAEAVEAHPGDADGWRYVWSWIDEERGLIRARCFVTEAGIAEDEATGSAALRLCAELDREIEFRQGRGSVIRARPLGGGRVEIGGRVVED